MRKIYSLIFLTILFISSYAISEEINPFGFKLWGDVNEFYIDQNIRNEAEIRPRSTCYDNITNPPIKNSNFLRYRVCTTPISKKIFFVQGRTNSEGCHPLFGDLIQIISKKYNINFSGSKTGRYPKVSAKFYNSNLESNIVISILCTEQKSKDLWIGYELDSNTLETIIKNEANTFEEKRLENIDQKGF